VIAIFISLAVLVLAFGWLLYRLVLAEHRIDSLEYQQREKIDADAKMLAALSEANSLKSKVQGFESMVTVNSQEVGKLLSKQAELDADRTEQQAREKQSRRVVLPLAQGW